MGINFTCSDIQETIALFPTEITTCCKRFTFKGKLQGTIPIVTDFDNINLNIQEINKRKQRLVDAINNERYFPCTVCPWLHKQEVDVGYTLKYLYINSQTICNFRCCYCGEEFYGGERALYDVVEVLSSLLSASNGEVNIREIQWAGGEPTLNKEFSNILSYIVNNIHYDFFFVATNASIYSSDLHKAINDGKVSIVTSIDAGTPETFKQVRGVDKFHLVVKNLNKYASSRPSSVTIKYVLTHNNFTCAELEAFAKTITKSNLNSCNIYLNFDYRDGQVLSLERIKNYSFLYCLLKQSGCRYVSFGYRYWNFIEDISEAERGSIIDFLKEKGLGEFIADHSKHKEYVVYGAGHDTLTLLKKTHFFAQSKLLFFVDDDSTKQDSEYCGYPVYSTEKLLKSDLPIFLPLVFIPRTVTPIREKLIKMGVSENRIIDGLML